MFDEKEQEKFKKMLEEERDKLRSELSKFANPSENSDDFKTRHDELGTHKDESATEVEEYVDNISVESSLEQRLKDIKSALEKIENGTFGACEECGEAIRRERLEIYPAAKKCMKCNQ
ncbi:MAG: TraR/DksA C4-type zinc finger protein [Candidatus Moranbacteria bacterium]|nr:TraR/DksA C4-type zinc finger protein [Candidatus Moranbacteria bacterium]